MLRPFGHLFPDVVLHREKGNSCRENIHSKAEMAQSSLPTRCSDAQKVMSCNCFANAMMRWLNTFVATYLDYDGKIHQEVCNFL